MIILQKAWIQLKNGEWYLGEEEIKDIKETKRRKNETKNLFN